MLEVIRTLVLLIGWPILIVGSIFLFKYGTHVIKTVHGFLVADVIKIMVISMLVEMYSLAIVCTYFMFVYIQSVYLVVPVFLVWLIFFLACLRVIIDTERKARIMEDSRLVQLKDLKEGGLSKE